MDLRSKFFARAKFNPAETISQTGTTSTNQNSLNPNDPGFFDLEKFLSNRNSEIIHTHIKGCNKIEISPSGSHLYFGGDGIHCLELVNGEYKLSRKDTSNSRKTIHLISLTF